MSISVSKLRPNIHLIRAYRCLLQDQPGMRFNRLRAGRALRNSCIDRELSASQDCHVLISRDFRNVGVSFRKSRVSGHISRKGTAVSRALWFSRLPSLYSGVDRYLIVVGLRSGSVRIRSQIRQQLEKLRSLADEKSVVSESGGCARRSARSLGWANNRTDWEA